MIKIACTSDPELLTIIEELGQSLLHSRFKSSAESTCEPIERAIAAMLSELSKNPYEISIYERAVDLGHTIAHTLEASTDYTLHHGFAVAIDLAFSCVVGWRLGWVTQEWTLRIVDLLGS